MRISLLWEPPAVNPVTRKALSVPVLNPRDKYGRMFLVNTFAFMIAFLSWYAFPPLLTKTIKDDLKLTQAEIANSNIMALAATLLVRLLTGPLCDRFGARKVFAGVLFLGSLPTFLAATITNARGLLILRFFIGILGASFVPCQVWSTGFFDETIVGTANALMAGIGNAGGGITYFVMPAIFDSLVEDWGLGAGTAWRVAFVVPGVLIMATAVGMLVCCEDTPRGKWAERHLPGGEDSSVEDVAGNQRSGNASSIDLRGKEGSGSQREESATASILQQQQLLLPIQTGSANVVQNPTLKESLKVVFSLQAMMLAAPYACSFGGELAINSILGAYYNKNFPDLGQTKSGQWASMFGLLNIFFRPFGGIAADLIYRHTTLVESKKLWLMAACLFMSLFSLLIGFLDPHQKATMFSLVAGLAFCMDSANGANFAVVPHVFPHANGVLSGFVGAMGNLGGIVFAIVFRYNGVDYARSIWISGFVMLGVTAVVCWISPVPKGKKGEVGR
ncbi:nitrate transporter [Ascodesmis nigricans]|uniref:Nitrate/nitrite transporter n=1 Tax=Ascodesmis nigricans TaxID=341454 RepID=A0A4S2MZX2_9PEZI|nr:nitrate transporter [Ascodesmis nigricans]